MGISPDVSGARGLGRPQTLNTDEQQQTANSDIQKLLAGQMKDSLDVPFTQIGGNIWKYQAQSNKPLLTQNVLTAMVRYETRGENPRELEKFKELQKRLPLDLQMGLKRSMMLPSEERDPVFIIFEAILRFAAKAFAFVETRSEIKAEDFSKETSKFSLLGKILLRGWCREALILREMMITVTKEQKPLSQNKKDLEESIKVLTKLLNFARTLLKSNKEETKKITEKLNKELLLIEKIFFTLKDRKSLLVTRTLIDNLLPIAYFFSLEEQHPILLGIDSGLQGCFTRDSSNLHFGKVTKRLLNTLYNEELVAENNKFFLIKIAGIALFIMSTLNLSSSGLTQLKVKDDPRLDSESMQNLALKLGSTMLAEYQVHELVATKCMLLLEENKPSKAFNALLAFLSIQGLLLSSGEIFGGSILKGWKKNLQKLLDDLKKSEVELKIPENIIALLQQATIAVNKEHFLKFREAVNQTLHDDEAATFKEELDEFKSTIDGFVQSLHDMKNQAVVTDVVRQAA